MKRYSQFNNIDKEFYFFLGLLSTKFAIVEYNIIKFLGRLVTDNFVLTNTILEKNSIARNLELIKDINKYRKFEFDAVNELINKILDIKKNRNLFIHGLWGEPIEKDNDWIIRCDQPKIDYTEEKEENEKVIAQTWSAVTIHEFRLSYIKKLVERLSDIILVQYSLFEKIEDA